MAAGAGTSVTGRTTLDRWISHVPPAHRRPDCRRTRPLDGTSLSSRAEATERAMDRGWRIELLGELRARRGDQIVTRFPKQLAASLLAYLACHPQHPHTREALLEALCPDLALEDARNSLRVALHLLRRQLKPPGTPE